MTAASSSTSDLAAPRALAAAQRRAQRRAAIDAEIASWEAHVYSPSGYGTQLRARAAQARALVAELGLDIEIEDTAESVLGSGSIPGALPMPSPYSTSPTPAIAARIEAPAVVLSRGEVAGVGLAGMAASIATAGLLGLLGALLDLVLR